MDQPRFKVTYTSGDAEYSQTITGYDVLVMKLETIKNILLKGGDITKLEVKQR